MSFLNDVISEFTHHGNNSSNPTGPPPPLSAPWIAEWDSRDARWLFVNQQTGERTFDYPGPGYQNQGGYAQGYQNDSNYNQGYGEQQGYQQQQGYYGEEERRNDGGANGLKYGALGAAAGVAGGALLMHEGEEMKESWDRDKYALESGLDNRVDSFENDVSDLPSDAAYYTGQKIQEVENIPENIENRWDNAVQDVEDVPQDIENKWDNAVQDVEDVPEDVAGWVGDKVGGVERFGDEMGDAYDAGRDDERYGGDDGGDDGGW